MPRFAANLTMLWPELPVLDRFRVAAQAGFKRVEILFVHELERIAQCATSTALRRTKRPSLRCSASADAARVSQLSAPVII